MTVESRAGQISGAVLLALLAIVCALPAQADARIATGGLGRYVSAIDWIEWGTANFQPLTGVQTRSSTTSVGGLDLVVTCSLSNFTGQVAGAYRPGTWMGDAMDDLYNIGGVGNANTLFNAVANTTPGEVQADFSCSATLGGNPFPLNGLVFGDAEQSGSLEWVEGTIASGATWRIIDRLRLPATCTTSTQAIRTDNGTTNTLRLQGANPLCATGAAAVAFADGATSGSFLLHTPGTAAIAFGAVVTFDRGDAPASYGDAGHAVQYPFAGGDPPIGGPRSIFNDPLADTTQPPTRLGTSVDPGGTASANADGDDVATSGGAFGADDDEDADPPATVTLTGPTYTQTVPCTGPGTVAGWIDFNANGTFDAAERAPSAPCTGSSVVLTWTVPAGVQPQAQTFQRLRIAVDASQVDAPTGFAFTGEAEDHAFALEVAPPTVTLAEPPSPITVGDVAPVDFACTGVAAPIACTAVVTVAGGGSPVPVHDGDPLPATVPGTYTITATVTDALGRTATTSRTYVVLPTPDLSVLKTVDKRTVEANEPITWTYTVTNPGPGVSKGVTAIDQPSQPVSFRLIRSTAGTCHGTGPVRCELGTIAPGASVTVTLVGRARIAGTLTNGVTVSAKLGNGQPAVDPTPANNVARVTSTVRGDLRIRKTANKPRVHAGERIGFTIRVTNPTGVAVRTVRVCDKLPSGILLVKSSAKAVRSNGRWCWDLQTVAARSSKVIRMTTRTLTGARGPRTNTATVTGRGVSARSDAAPSVTVLGAAARGGGVTG
jgi:uncharacterized repeat protein (TIGR01451 family)